MRRALVTGGTRGLGAVVAAGLRRQGWEVVTIARRGADLSFDVAGPWPDVGHVHGLVCAAGVIGTPGTPEVVEDFERVLSVNVVGTWNAIRACAGSLRRHDGAVVTFSGGGATSPFPNFDAYAASKAAVVRLTENVASGGLRANAIAPGFVVTGMQDDVLAAGPERVGEGYYDEVREAVARGGGEDPQLAADLAAFLLSDDAQGITGKLISARWDPWREPGFQQRLRTEKDLATLRRIDDRSFTTC